MKGRFKYDAWAFKFLIRVYKVQAKRSSSTSALAFNFATVDALFVCRLTLFPERSCQLDGPSATPARRDLTSPA